MEVDPNVRHHFETLEFNDANVKTGCNPEEELIRIDLIKNGGERIAHHESNKLKADSVRGALGDRRNTSYLLQSTKLGKAGVDKLYLKDIPKSFEVYCDNSSANDSNNKECEKRKAESADEQFERVDPDATVEGFSTGEEEGILQVYLLKTISGHVVFCPNKWNGISESFGWKYDFGFDSLVCSTFSRLNGNSSIPLEASSDVDDTVLVDDW
ncbi:unnamed protein product [Enterobius vermicularis]|uniref:TLDc domain-containing protein n=1 Tax=Enterobius vermicularis TaxID=51028 RepID=A0A0N4VPN0_ENTVE|nr:unnamed protein product [Enterobius vermicularis]